MLSGRAPFVDDDAVVVMARHIKDPPPRFDAMSPEVKVPDSVAELLWRVLAKSPSDRPESAERMIAELDAAEASARVLESGLRPTLAARHGAARRRHGLVWLVIAGLAGLALVALALFGPRRAKPGTPMAQAEPTLGPVAELVSAPVTEPVQSESASPLENSASAPAPIAASAAASAPSAPTTKKGTRVHAKPALQKKGNERYGRFD